MPKTETVNEHAKGTGRISGAPNLPQRIVGLNE
jgi:hypothetical protein